jgi:glycosyltransferase involved in cell wall biosynthesis
MTMLSPRYSIVIPVYNRPQEVEELLESLTLQTFSDFEVILVEDGSSITCKEVFEQYSNRLNIRYFFKPNTGPGPSRNFGFEQASGAYFVAFDSDCLIPPGYFAAVEKSLQQKPLDAWGGPDRGSDNFTPLQQAMAYTMSSALTTGGIRGGVAQGFQPRSFNMGISRAVFNKTKGFQFARLAEDIELSIRMKKQGFRVGLIPEAWVYHKRRTDFEQFFRQVSGFGKGRVQVGRVHKGAVKIAHWFPAFFFMGLFAIPFLLWLNLPLGLVMLGGYAGYLLLVGIDAWLKTTSITVAILSIPSAFVQLNGYGSGFLKELFRSGL